MPKIIYPDCLTVGELKKILEQYPDDMKIGKNGHFGEFHEMSPIGVAHQKSGYMVGKAQRWQQASKHPRTVINFLELETPDIGPEPD